MGYLLDTNICSAHLKRPAGLMHRFMQHAGRLYIPTIVVGELYTWAFLRPDPLGFTARIENDLLPELMVLDYDKACAEQFGRIRATLIRQGVTVSRLDLMIGSIAVLHKLTLVTNNLQDFQDIPGLSLEDWLTP